MSNEGRQPRFDDRLQLEPEPVPARWEPSASLEVLRLRARILREVREFFAERGVLEVETPYMSEAGTPDCHLHSFRVRAHLGDTTEYRPYFLHTSPEYPMKRLLAAGSGPIYQICRVFRASEQGRLHNPEFTMLEWYRPGFDQHQLMDEVEALLDKLIESGPCERMSFAQAFLEFVGIDPHPAGMSQLRRRARELGVEIARGSRLDRNGILDLLLSHSVAPNLGDGEPTFLFDFPASQAALARVREGSPTVAERFELFINGMEIANGYRELTHPIEHSLRLELEKWRRRQLRLPPVPVDERFLSAVYNGLPDCAGVALGLDRVIMLAAGVHSLQEVLAFPTDRA